MAKNPTSGIYKFTNPIGKHYIGRSVNVERRFREHKRMRQNQPKLHASFREHGFENHSFEIVELCNENLHQREVYWKVFYDSVENGLNHFYDEEYVVEWTDELRKQVSEKRKGRTKSAEWKQKISESLMGHPGACTTHTKEARIKISKAAINRKRIHNGKIEKRIKVHLLSEYLEAGWILGGLRKN